MICGTFKHTIHNSPFKFMIISRKFTIVAVVDHWFCIFHIMSFWKVIVKFLLWLPMNRKFCYVPNTPSSKPYPIYLEWAFSVLLSPLNPIKALLSVTSYSIMSFLTNTFEVFIGLLPFPSFWIFHYIVNMMFLIFNVRAQTKSTIVPWFSLLLEPLISFLICAHYSSVIMHWNDLMLI